MNNEEASKLKCQHSIKPRGPMGFLEWKQWKPKPRKFLGSLPNFPIWGQGHLEVVQWSLSNFSITVFLASSWKHFRNAYTCMIIWSYMIVYAHLLSFAFSAKAFGWASDSRGRANQGPKAICRRCILFHDHVSWCFRTWKLRSTEDDTTPFQLAAWGGHVPLCEWLLSQKAALPRYTTFKSSRKLWEDKAIKDRRRSRKNVSQAFWTQADLHHRNSWSCLAHHFAALAGWTKAANV